MFSRFSLCYYDAIPTNNKIEYLIASFEDKGEMKHNRERKIGDYTSFLL